MQKDYYTYASVTNGSKKNTYKAPTLFAIPPNVYCEEMERDRNKDLYLKIQKLEKNSELLRQQLSCLSERKEEMIAHTQSLLSESRAVRSNFENRKIVLQEIINTIKMFPQG